MRTLAIPHSRLGRVAFVTLFLSLSQCTHGRLIPNDQIITPFVLDLSPGTVWDYLDVGDISATRGDEAHVQSLHTTWYFFKSVGLFQCRGIGVTVSHRAEVMGKPAQIRSNNTKFGSRSGYFLNTAVGLVHISNRTDPSGSLVVPARGSPVTSFFYIDACWRVAVWDMLITVPCGTFSCIAIEHEGHVYDHHIEFWAPEVGLVRYVELGFGNSDWQLIRYARPGKN